MVAGATARIWAVSLVSPLELIRTKMQSQKLSYEGNQRFYRKYISDCIKMTQKWFCATLESIEYEGLEIWYKIYLKTDILIHRN